ncbi:hypothetical protein EN828_11560 [Mesorhizobium sp. M2D.F.Ca.ET.185.01.1.1]|uniref:hypothetical protein n=1 Tax=unclassified Mesorhizobium TaxID=325217 RepID=UPI000FCB0522|nr:MULTISPECIES: hypothetical protein [unclassified Mesorhizobium]TGP69030.1 hypothetical protein EN868_10370 [Mesorhizobium sp. M2D.F.Ca.ET.225.01.1.1]TGP80910.1 hypothetical protein EN870_10340 [bacterium M00.F.Ca.ET.227.01.1.1]TGP90693.1 hypothetical protein EN864_18210 [bacterium M00.F.Ca.ET.221.01.1.1]TGP97372.1 hypothetical protein EN865_11980 [bacterium M00.F.Ca.ET.222.01.1.1]TGU26243.1 hypothetical protein EN799_44930 [bacterium M00.F.Ca.ET.156.01.1.1]TGU47083.1 hypothetical protein E
MPRNMDDGRRSCAVADRHAGIATRSQRKYQPLLPECALAGAGVAATSTEMHRNSLKALVLFQIPDAES